MLTTVLLLAVCSLAGTTSRAQTQQEPQGPDNVAASTRVGVLTLINGNSLEGRLGESDSAESVSWHATHFSAPFQFRPGQIKSIKFPIQREPNQGGEFAFEFTSGDVLMGQLVDWSNTAIGIQSNQFGRINVRPAAIRRLHRIEENATLVFASLAGLQDWKTTNWETSGWDEDGDHLLTRQPGATLCGDLRVPDCAVVEFELAWDDKPTSFLPSASTLRVNPIVTRTAGDLRRLPGTDALVREQAR